MSQSEGQVAPMVKCSRPSQTDVIFVAMNDHAEKVQVEDLVSNANVTVKSYPCVFDLTLVFLSLLFLGFILGFQIRNGTSTLKKLRATHE